MSTTTITAINVGRPAITLLVKGPNQPIDPIGIFFMVISMKIGADGASLTPGVASLMCQHGRLLRGGRVL